MYDPIVIKSRPAVPQVKHMDLLALTDFNAVARHGGVGRAARATGRPKATLSRKVAELEASLGVRLLERGAGAVKLTEEGKALFARTASLLAEVDEAAASIASGGGKPQGKLRVSAPLLFSQYAMGKLAAGFALQYPAVRLDVTTEDRSVDMVEEGYDLVIRVNPDPDENLVGRIFLRDRLVAVAHPDLPRPDGSGPVRIVARATDGEKGIWQVSTAAGRAAFEVAAVLRLSSLVMVRDAVRLKVGAARLPLSLVSHELKAGTLVSWGDVEGTEVALWALYPSRRLLSVRVSAFLAYLRETFPNGTPDELAAFVGG